MSPADWESTSKHAGKPPFFASDTHAVKTEIPIPLIQNLRSLLDNAMAQSKNANPLVCRLQTRLAGASLTDASDNSKVCTLMNLYILGGCQKRRYFRPADA